VAFYENDNNTETRARNFAGSLLLIPLVVLSLTGPAPRSIPAGGRRPAQDMPEVKETSFDKPLADLGR
jgi:hypothetical protein